jgi:hypothetical protein
MAFLPRALDYCFTGNIRLKDVELARDGGSRLEDTVREPREYLKRGDQIPFRRIKSILLGNCFCRPRSLMRKSRKISTRFIEGLGFPFEEDSLESCTASPQCKSLRWRYRHPQRQL